MPVPVITFDVDGTLLNHADQIHPNDLAILHSGRTDVLLVPNTGRPLVSMRGVAGRKGMFNGHARIPVPMVLQNGGVRYFPHEVTAEADSFTPEVQEALFEIARRFPHTPLMLNCVDHIYDVNPNEFSTQAAVGFDFTVLPFSAYRPGTPVVKFMWVSEQPADLRELKRQVQAEQIPGAITTSMPIILEINPPGVDKGTGVRRLMQLLDMADSPLYAVGDGGNDLQLLEAADHSFAPLTTSERVQAAADEVIDASREGILLPMLRRAGLE